MRQMTGDAMAAQDNETKRAQRSRERETEERAACASAVAVAVAVTGAGSGQRLAGRWCKSGHGWVMQGVASCIGT